jgi:hypothetical protein
MLISSSSTRDAWHTTEGKAGRLTYLCILFSEFCLLWILILLSNDSTASSALPL